jgi:hypothetical protein
VPCACGAPTVAGVPGGARMEAAAAWRVDSVALVTVRRVQEPGGGASSEIMGALGLSPKWGSEEGGTKVWVAGGQVVQRPSGEALYSWSQG